MRFGPVSKFLFLCLCMEIKMEKKKRKEKSSECLDGTFANPAIFTSSQTPRCLIHNLSVMLHQRMCSGCWTLWINTRGVGVNKTPNSAFPQTHQSQPPPAAGDQTDEIIGPSGGTWCVGDVVAASPVSAVDIDVAANEVWHMAWGQEVPPVVGKVGVSKRKEHGITPTPIARTRQKEK